VTDTAPILPTATTTDAGAAHAAVAVLSVGSFEQHGPYLPLVTDTLIAAAIADAIAGHHENVFQLLAIAYGCSHEHAAFPGTVSISATTLSAVVAYIAESCAHQGITALIIVNAHGGNSVLTNVAHKPTFTGRSVLGSTPAAKTGLNPAPRRASRAASTTTCTPVNSKRPFCWPRTPTMCAGPAHH
jgi:creatinine amidohydrolase